MFYVYVLINPDRRLYIGSTDNLDKRVKRHQAGKAGWTHLHGPWKLIHQEVFLTRAEAMRRERILKGGKTNQELRKFVNELKT